VATLASWAEAFAAIFKEGGNVFTGIVGGILPGLIVLMTAINALVSIIGIERVEELGRKAGGTSPLLWPVRYFFYPFIAGFILTNPITHMMGKFLPERYKAAWVENSFRAMHYGLGLFPHMNPGEIFTWAGISSGVESLGYSTAELAVRYLLCGAVLMTISGIITEKMYFWLWARGHNGQQPTN